MKKILMICLALVMGLGMCAAAGKPAQKKEVTTVFVTDIDCEHCVKKIMNNVPSLGKGIKDVKVDLPKKEVTVIYDASKNNDENIVKGFATIKVKAEPKVQIRQLQYFIISVRRDAKGKSLFVPNLKVFGSIHKNLFSFWGLTQRDQCSYCRKYC